MTVTLQTRKKESYKIFDEIAGTYDFLNRFLSMGIDVYWRKKLLQHLPPNPQKALDLATGTGDVAIVLAGSKKIKKIIGLDMSSKMVELGKEKILKKGLQNKISLSVGDGVEVPFPENSFDLVTISFGIRNFSDHEKSLRNIYKTLRIGGRLLVMEFSLPKNFIIRNLYLFYFRNILPFIGNIVSKHKDAYSYLNKTVEDFPYGNDFKDLMIKSGFENCYYKSYTFGIASLYVGEKV